MKTIIAGLALDGDEEPVINRAMQLAGQHEARLILAHVIENTMLADSEASGGLDANAMKAMLESVARDCLGEITAPARAHIRLESVVIAEGKPFVALTGLQLREEADLIVIGPGKPRNLRERVFGSTADRIVRSASVPVLIVRRGLRQPYRRVVVAADLSPQSLSASRAAQSLSPDATIEHVHVVEMPLSFEQALLRAGASRAEIDRYREARLIAVRDRLRAAFAGADGSPPLKLRMLQGAAGEIMARQARNRRTDLLAIGTHGRDAASQMLLGSVARHVLRSASCDVLVVPR